MYTNEYIIRRETPKDHRIVETLTREAFWNLSVPGCDEHYFVHTMRTHPDFVPELALVLELNGRIIANVMYTKAALVDEQGDEKTILSFGPICVHPDFQRKGYGKALLEYSFARAVEMGYDTVVIFGNPDNYVTRGFKSCKKYNVCYGDGFYPAALLVKELIPHALDGKTWRYCESTAAAACEDKEAVAAFDALFPPRKKAWQPSQEEFYIHSHSMIV